MDNFEVKVLKYPKTREEILDALFVRYTVLRDEQGFPKELEEDEYDTKSYHIILYCNNKPIGNVRLVPLKPIIKLTRLCILKEFRGKNLSRYLMAEYLKQCQILKKDGYTKSYLEGQVQVLPFYEIFGYKTVSDIIIVQNYPHKKMELIL